MKKRIDKDSLGEIQIPFDALYGPQTQRAVENFNFSSYIMPKDFLISLLEIKKAAAKSNYKLKLISKNKCDAIVKSTEYLINNYDDKNFPVDVFQTGSGTSTNMNVNEVIARVAKIKFKTEVHPNDDINKCQSSNDVIPTCISYFSVKSLNGLLIPGGGATISPAAIYSMQKTIEVNDNGLRDYPYIRPQTCAKKTRVCVWFPVAHKQTKKKKKITRLSRHLSLDFVFFLVW